MNLADVYLEYILTRKVARMALQAYILEKQWEQEPVEPGNRH